MLKAQNSQLALSFYEEGSYEKAILEYNKLITKEPNRVDYLLKKVMCLQELKEFHKAQQALERALNGKYKRPQLIVELGYNFALQHDSVNAKKYYDVAINQIKTKPHHAFTIGKSFENHNLLQEAIVSYKTATKINPQLNLGIQLARLYGELNQIYLMFESYLNQMLLDEKNIPRIQQLISVYISDNSEAENNIKLKRTLLKKIQLNQNTLWNKQLSWLFVQQQQYNKAFIQEKAIFKRGKENLFRLFNLGVTALEHDRNEAAISIFKFIQLQPLAVDTQVQVIDLLLKIEQKSIPNSNYKELIDKYEKVLDTFGIANNTVNVQLAYVDVLAFKAHEITKALAFLKTNKNQKLNRFDKAKYQMKYADILVADSQFSTALINYSKIQNSIKNNVLSQEARFKVAKTSYYKGDFDWALSQLEVLKTSTTQLIANDALDLHLLINDHIKEDSLHTALKKYAKADLLAFQNKDVESIALLQDILNIHVADKIEDDALLLQAKLFVKQGEVKLAIKNYKKILLLEHSIFKDDALFRLAKLNINLGEEKQAKDYFESIIFNHPDSIFFVEAQKQFRKLRGDNI